MYACINGKTTVAGVVGVLKICANTEYTCNFLLEIFGLPVSSESFLFQLKFSLINILTLS